MSYARNEFVADNVFKPGCLVVPIHTGGFQNCDLFFDKVIIDDVEHVKGFKYYKQFKSRMTEVGDIENGKATGRDNNNQRIIAYCGGIALHDLFYGYKIYQIAMEKGYGTDVDMNYPETHLWI